MVRRTNARQQNGQTTHQQCLHLAITTQVPAATAVGPPTHAQTVLLGSLCAIIARRRATSRTSVALGNESRARWRSLPLHAILETEKAKAKYVEVNVDNYTAIFKVDSGAEASAVSEAFPNLPHHLDKVDDLLTAPGDQSLKVIGYFMATLLWRGKTGHQRLYVIKSLSMPLLGFPAIQALGVVKFLDDMKVPAPQGLFRGLGTLKEEYKIRLRPDAVPFSLSVPCRIPIPLREVVQTELAKLEQDGAIRRVTNPTPRDAGLFMVPKSSGGYRVCIDFTKLNQVVPRERHVLPTVDQVLGLLGDAAVFSKLKVTSSFHQVKLSKDSQELTMFITPYGRYCFCRLPFGITSAPEFFQRQVAWILEVLDGLVNMVDDILVFGRTKKEHDQRLRQVLLCLSEAGVTPSFRRRFGLRWTCLLASS